MTWARAGCLVLVPDHLGHGERRQHPFGSEGRHDYHGRYDLGIAQAAKSLGMELLFTSDPVLNECPGGWLASDLIGRIPISTASVADGNGHLDPERVMPWLMLRQ